jgi:hypothetical protein
VRDGKTKHHHRAVCRATMEKNRFHLISPHISQNTFLDFCCSELGMVFSEGWGEVIFWVEIRCGVSNGFCM